MGWDDGIILIRISDRLDLDGGSWVANAVAKTLRAGLLSADPAGQAAAASATPWGR